MRLKPPLKVVRGPNVDVAIAQLKKLYVPHRRDGLAMLMTARRPTFLRPPKRAPRRREALGPRAVLRETLYTPNRLRVSVHFVACHPKPKAKAGGGRSLVRTLLYRNSLITPDLQGKNAKKQGIRASVLDISIHFQSFTGEFPTQWNREF
jgi:hypothetical protein